MDAYVALGFVTQQEWDRWVELKKERTILSVKDLPDWIQKNIELHIKQIVEQCPQTKQIYLTGSLTNGEYVFEDSPEEIKILRNKIKRKARSHSDYDYIIVPRCNCKFKDFDIAVTNWAPEILIYSNDIQNEPIE